MHVHHKMDPQKSKLSKGEALTIGSMQKYGSIKLAFNLLYASYSSIEEIQTKSCPTTLVFQT